MARYFDDNFTNEVSSFCPSFNHKLSALYLILSIYIYFILCLYLLVIYVSTYTSPKSKAKIMAKKKLNLALQLFVSSCCIELPVYYFQ